jgi:hypothetical protein
VLPIFHPAHPAVPAAASAPSLTSGLGLPGFEFRGGVPVPVGHGAAVSRQSTRWLGPWVTPSVGPRGRRPRHQTLLGYGGPRRRILKATAALKSLRLFARVHGGGLRAERIPTYLCEEVFSDTHFAAGAVFPLGISICWPDTMPDIVRPMLRSASSTWIRQPAAGRQGERRDSKRVGRERTTFDADLRLSFPPLSQPWHYVRSYPEEPLCWRSARRDEALSSLHFCFR